MNIHRALADVASIRAQLERTEALRGFRSAAVGFSVVILIIGYLVQRLLIVDANRSVEVYLGLWLVVALASATTAGIEMVVRGMRSEEPAVWNLHRQLAIRILPSLLVGFVITLMIGVQAWEARESPTVGMIWALPGIWSMIYGLGLLHCSRCLPRYSNGVACYFLAAGALVMVAAWLSGRQPAPWQMLATFGVGQTGLATVLYFNMDRELNRKDH
ncbi:MAG: hypothetical protein AAFN77_13755 [Planctomycetota bacterium]